MSYDAILICGGGLRAGGELPELVKRRFDLALEMQSGEPMVPLSAGTSHRPPPLDDRGHAIYESFAGARYLIDRGIEPRRIFCEITSLDTIGNAYFSRVQIVEPLGWRRLLIVTSQFHMLRTEAIFRWIYSLRAEDTFRLDCAASPNEGMGEAALAQRIEREQASLRRVERLRSSIVSMADLAKWLFTEHGAYRAYREPRLLPPGDILDTY